MSKLTPAMSEYQMSLLGEIFRVIAKEITCDEDKERLAPGEIGISYKEGCFYVRDPYTGELFCPNSVANIKQILAKYDSKTGLLNADYINGIRVYSSINQLDQLGIDLSADTVIRQMEYPSVLLASVEYENYQVLGFPSSSGLITVIKLSPEFVSATYYDNLKMSSYRAKYNPFRQYLEGWSADSPESEYVETAGTSDQVNITLNKDLSDMDILAVRVNTDLNPGAKISVNGNEYLPICNIDGTALDSTITANNIIMLIYDEPNKRWLMTDSAESATASVVNVLKDRLTTVTKDLTLQVKDCNEQIKELKKSTNSQITALKSRPGVITTVTSEWTAVLDNVDTINAVEGFRVGIDLLVINYRQTILREKTDYLIMDDGSISFTSIRFNKGDTLQLIVIKQPGPTE